MQPLDAASLEGLADAARSSAHRHEDDAEAEGDEEAQKDDGCHAARNLLNVVERRLRRVVAWLHGRSWMAQRRLPAPKFMTGGATARKSSVPVAARRCVASASAAAARTSLARELDRVSSEKVLTGKPAGRRIQAPPRREMDPSPARHGAKAAVDDHERLGAHRQTSALVDLGRDDDVDRLLLVLEQQERDALGGSRALAGDDEAADANARPMLQPLQPADADGALRAQALAQQPDRVARRRQPVVA